jgi:hypothetical protein
LLPLERRQGVCGKRQNAKADAQRLMREGPRAAGLEGRPESQ